MTLRLATGGKNQVGIPDDLALSNEVSYGGIIGSNYTYVNATPLGPYPGSKNTKIIINLPQEMVNLKDSYLEFQVTGSPGNTPSINCSFVPDIRSLISRMTLVFGSKTILDLDGYGLLQNIFDYTFDPQWANGNGSVLVASTPSQAVRQGYFLDSNKTYACRLAFCEGIESLFRKVMPFQKVGSQMQLQIYLNDSINVISTDIAVTGTVVPSYTVNQVEFHYITIVPTDNWNKMFDQKIMSNPGITFSYRGFDYQQDTSSLPAGVSSASKFLTYKYTSLLGLFIAFQPSTLPITWTSDNKLKYFYNPGVNLLRLKVGGQFYPTDQKTNDADVFGRFLVMTGISDEKPISAAANWNYISGSYPTNATYVATCPISKHPNSIRSDDRSVITGIDTSIATSLQLDLGFSNAVPSGGLIMHMWAYYEATITMNPNGSITLYT